MNLKYTLCFIKRGNELLMLNRNNSPNMGLWNGVGGKLEVGEQPADGMVREVLEETGIPLKTMRFTGTVTWAYQGENAGMYVYVAEVPDEFTLNLPISTDEGVLDWKPISWVIDPKNRGVVSNIPVFLPQMLDDSRRSHFSFIYEKGEIVSYTVNLSTAEDDSQYIATTSAQPGQQLLPDQIQGRSIHIKVIPTVCNLDNLLRRLVEVGGRKLDLKKWEQSIYNSHLLDQIKDDILNSEEEEWKNLFRDHILSNSIHDFGPHLVDIYLVAYVSTNYGPGKEAFYEYIMNAGITEKSNSVNAIWQVGKRDGVYLDILHDDGSVKDWDFVQRWIAE